MNQTFAIPRPAATLILVRDSLSGIEVFMVQRSHQAAFMAGTHVFPGGTLDEADADSTLAELCAGLDDAAASRRLGVVQGGLAYWIAAIRECYEEAGLLMARGPREVLLTRGELSPDARRQVMTGNTTLGTLCRSRQWHLATDAMAYFSRWITPPGLPRRYDTRFFIAVAPPEQDASHDERETIAHTWITPAQALQQFKAGTMQLAHATVVTLQTLARFQDTAALLQQVRSLPQVPQFNPRSARGHKGRSVITEEHPAYAEVSRLDPAGAGNARCEIAPGEAIRLAEKVWRITAPNPGVMTGPGTNSYLLGNGGDFAVIDPGPGLDSHIRALLQHCGGRISHVLVTHTHLDHSPAALQLKQLCGAELLGMPPPPHAGQDQDFRPDRVLRHGERITVAGCTLRVLHTPGHASNHLCYLLEDERMLFCGDHVMQGSTVIINPPDGDMRAYLDSLRMLRQEPIAWLAPAHGFLLGMPQQVLASLQEHRLARERKVLAALRSAGPATMDQLLPLAYDDVSQDRYPAARRSLLAHLLKLQYEGRAMLLEERWQERAAQ